MSVQCLHIGIGRLGKEIAVKFPDHLVIDIYTEKGLSLGNEKLVNHHITKFDENVPLALGMMKEDELLSKVEGYSCVILYFDGSAKVFQEFAGYLLGLIQDENRSVIVFYIDSFEGLRVPRGSDLVAKKLKDNLEVLKMDVKDVVIKNWLEDIYLWWTLIPHVIKFTTDSDQVFLITPEFYYSVREKFPDIIYSLVEMRDLLKERSDSPYRHLDNVGMLFVRSRESIPSVPLLPVVVKDVCLFGDFDYKQLRSDLGGTLQAEKITTFKSNLPVGLAVVTNIHTLKPKRRD